MKSPLIVARTIPAMSRAEIPHKATPAPRAFCERPERSGGPGRRENLERSVREEAGLARPGKFFRRTGCGDRLRGLARKRQAGMVSFCVDQRDHVAQETRQFRAAMTVEASHLRPFLCGRFIVPGWGNANDFRCFEPSAGGRAVERKRHLGPTLLSPGARMSGKKTPSVQATAPRDQHRRGKAHRKWPTRAHRGSHARRRYRARCTTYYQLRRTDMRQGSKPARDETALAGSARESPARGPAARAPSD